MRASTESSFDSDSVTRWCTHSSSMELYSFFFEPDFPTALDQAMERYKFEAEVIVRGSRRPRPRLRRNRMVPLLVRAGATINERYADRSDYLKAVLEAGGIRAYERQHRTTLANVLNRGTRLPADVIPKIVDYWAHVGWYAIERDEREYMYSDSELDEEGSFGS